VVRWGTRPGLKPGIYKGEERARYMVALQGRKSLRLCWTGVLVVGWFDPVAEASELPDHSRRTLLPGLFGDGWATFFVTDSLAQDQPDQSTLSMGNRPDGLIMSQARDAAAIHNLEDASFGPGCGVGRLVENATHVAVAFRRSVAVVHARALIVAGQAPTQEERHFA
jgi:hypothetical protein